LADSLLLHHFLFHLYHSFLWGQQLYIQQSSVQMYKNL
jgi:hypothetical protein